MLKIIVLGRGGQGAQTAGNLLALAFFKEGCEVQSFASYGGARRGSPVTSMLRVDDKPIRLRCDIEVPDAVLCFDKTLLHPGRLVEISRDTLIALNTTESTEGLANLGSGRVFPIDALSISQDLQLGRFVNSALLGAFSCLLGRPAIDTLSATIRESAPQKIDENVAACRAGFELVDRQLGQGANLQHAVAT